MSSPNENQIDKRIEQISRMWTRSQPAVAAYLASLVYDHHDAEDLLQRTAVAAVRKFEDFDEARSFTTWVVGIAHIEVMRYRREKSRDTRLIFSESAVEALAEVHKQLGDDTGSEMRAALAQCMGRLRGRSKQVVELFYRDGKKLDTVAAQLSIARGTVGSILHRTRKLLRECVDYELGRKEAGR
ncbi:sigma-70 family RNA polymerase sigma factor [Phycisphaeraceae bacterium D3-23]